MVFPSNPQKIDILSHLFIEQIVVYCKPYYKPIKKVKWQVF